MHKFTVVDNRQTERLMSFALLMGIGICQAITKIENFHKKSVVFESMLSDLVKNIEFSSLVTNVS